jgi:alpha-glucosidase (family GH31 glycosyl hydrolase)
VAKNFSSLNLSVGVIVIDLGPPADPPYYRLDPARFPDVAAMAAQVKALTGGAYLMPNLKPTSVKSSDCPACDAGHSHATDGKADDGKVDASSAACRQCIWNKRLKPALFDKNVTTFWLDDDEANKFKLEGQQCKPTTPNGSPDHHGDRERGLDSTQVGCVACAPPRVLPASRPRRSDGETLAATSA